MTQFALHPDAHLVASLNRIVWRIELRTRLVDLDIADGKIGRILRCERRIDGTDLLLDDLQVLAEG